jgi:tetratricopeptide (TPR) repeat protein
MRLAAAIWMSVGMMCAGASAQPSSTNPLVEKIRAQESAVDPSHGQPDGIAWLRLAILYQDAARYTDAERAYRKAIAMLKSKDRSTLASAFDHMGTMYVERGKFAKAEPMERKALAMRQDANDTEGIGASYAHLATLSYGRHDLASAEADAEIAVSLLAPEHAGAAQSKATPEEKMSALIDLSLVRCSQGKCAGAIRDLNRALLLAHANYPINSVPVGFIDFLLGYAHWKSGDDNVAAELMKCGITEMETQLGWGHPTYISALKQYRTFLSQRGAMVEAEELTARISTLEKSPRSASAESAGTTMGLLR